MDHPRENAMTRRFLLPLLLLAAAPLAAPARAADNDPVLADEMALKAVGLPTDGPGLVEFFRLRGQADAAPEKIAALVKQLDTADLAVREKACGELIAVGPPALPELRRAARDVDSADAAALANRCLRALDADSAKLTGAAARLLAVRRPAGAAETLLAFLPYVENESVLDDVKTALVTVAYREGKPDDALVKALADETPLRRAVAIEVLCSNGRAEPRATLRRLLQDPVPVVRFQAGVALVQCNDAEAIATMISTLADLPLPMARQVEEYLYALAGEQGPKPSQATDADARKKQRDAWKAWWDANDGAGALAEIRKRTLTDADREKGMKLLEQLGDDDFPTREKATNEFKSFGASMIPVLRTAMKHEDLEIRRRVRECLETIEQDKNTPLPLTAPRIVAVRKPAGAAEAMLAYLPFIEDETTLDEIQAALNALGAVDGKPDPALARALTDKVPIRRGAAALALCHSPTTETLPEVRKLLKDPDASVRLQVALGLAGAREREAVPVLIALVGDLPADRSGPAEEYLLRLAADRPPPMPSGEGDLRPKRREAWEAWWAAQGAKVELIERNAPALAQRFLGYTILVQPQQGWVTELGADGKQRWQITGLGNPMDVQVLPGNRVLVAEYNQRRVTERNFKGEKLWEKMTNGYPISAQRLPNGNTLIVSNNQLLEVDRSGKEVFTFNRQFGDIMTAAKTRDGQIVCLSNQGLCFRLGPDGKETKSFRIQQVPSYGNEVLPNGHVLVANTWQNKVQEYDPDGKLVWEANAMQPQSASRLPNGNTVISLQQWPAKVIELDRQGKQVAEIPVQTFVQRARKR
jgi:HEAT repeat protein